MIRLTFLLCAGLFAAMLIAGRDHGQLRFGLMEQAPEAPPLVRQPAAAAITSTPPKAEVAVFAPAAPVMTTPVVLETTAAAPVVVAAPESGKIPVSYKHLDVYKRQVWISSASFSISLDFAT